MMKKSIYSIVIGLAAAIAATGCAHRPVRVTPIPNPPTQIGEENPNTMPQQPLVNPNAPISAQPVGEAGPFNPDDWNQDRAALAAYTIHFSFDSAVIRDSERANLQQVAAALQADSSANLLIEGNCDERGTEEYNRSLGERRAEAAREALVGMGIDESRIHTISYGKDKPLDPGHNETAWTQNRRDDFVLLHPKTGA
ncbi:MAG: OmpA family protein [Limisphaerales bacterium]